MASVELRLLKSSLAKEADSLGYKTHAVEVAAHTTPLPRAPPRHTPPNAPLARLTVHLRDEHALYALNGARPELLSYDVVAAAPETDAILERLLSSPVLDCIDIVLLPSDHSRALRPSHALVRRVLDAGIGLEMSYAAALSGAAARRSFVGALSALADVLPKRPRRRGGAGLVLSSGADDALLLRTPLDVANLAVWLGCSSEMARAAVRESARHAVERGARRRTPAPLAAPVLAAEPPEQAEELAAKRRKTA